MWYLMKTSFNTSFGIDLGHAMPFHWTENESTNVSIKGRVFGMKNLTFFKNTKQGMKIMEINYDK